MSKLILIDGSSYLYRAFHALPPLSNTHGEPTGALLGVVNMLRATLKARPDFAAFVSDAPGPTFRDALYPAYKAHRPPMPDELRTQIEPMLAIVAALGLPILRVPGVEADDVIGTLALAAHAQGIAVEISTGDKDMAQLVRPGITLINTMTNSTLDEAGVLDKFGVPPSLIIDYLSLVGDAVDNVPGVSKCGPKTAVKWLGAYGTLDGVMTQAAEMDGKIGENLRAALPQLPLSKALVTIKTDVALDVAVADLALRAPDITTLRELYMRYEFRVALQDLDSAHDPMYGQSTANEDIAKPLPPRSEERGERTSANETGHYELITTPEQLRHWLRRLQNAPLIALDTETTSIDAMHAALVGLSFSIEAGTACYIPLGHDYPGAPSQLPREDVLATLRPLLEDPTKPKLAQHAKYDINVLLRHGIRVAGLAHDTMLESYVWNATANRHDMDTLARKYRGYDTLTFEEVCGKGAKQRQFSQVELAQACRYAAEDADITLRLHQHLNPLLQSEPGLHSVYRNIEMPLVPVLAAMERTGVLIDVPALRLQSQQLARHMLRLQREVHDLAGHEFNLDSTKQLQAVLFDELGLATRVKTPKGHPSTNEEALAAIADDHPLPRLILDYRSLAKLRSTYTDKLAEMVHPVTGRVHTSYHQASVATGRLSSSDPNLQNIPVRTQEGRRIRQAFIAPEGWRVMAADYSQIELRLMAHLSGDPGLLSAFRAGQDVHRATAAEAFGLDPMHVSGEQRRAAKAINFGLMYGMGAFGLARQLGIGRQQAQDYMTRYFQRYPGVQSYMDSIRERAHRDGYVETLCGRRLYLDYIHARNPAQRAGAERAAVNAPMQGSAADLIKRAMISIHAWMSEREDARMLMQVHDELVFEVRADAVEEIRSGVQARMESAMELAVPLLIDIGVGANWDEAH